MPDNPAVPTVPLSDRLAPIISDVVNLEARATRQEEDLTLATFMITQLEAKNAELEAEVKRLTGTVTPPPPPPPPPAADIPDVTITFAGVTLRPAGPGELYPPSGERRWSWRPTPSIWVLLDVVGPQCRVILRRGWGDLPVTAAVEEHPVTVTIDGKKMWDRPVRIHHHQGPPMTFQRQFAPRATSFPTPNYVIPQARMDQLRAEIAEGLAGKKEEWNRWKDIQPSDAFDQWTENYGLAIRSWVGGIPLSNEASWLPMWDVALLKTGDQDLWRYVAETWDSSGCYSMHFYDKATGEPYRPETLPTSVPVLNADNLPGLKSRAGLDLPRADMAHDFGLCSLAALLTRERFYAEALESMVLLGSIVRKGDLRSSGLYFSGQVRSVAWFLRNLFHLYVVLPDGPKRAAVRKQLQDNLVDMNRRFARPDSREYHVTGITATSPWKPSPWSEHSTPGLQTRSGNHYFLAHVLNEIRQGGIGMDDLAEPILRHVLRVAKGTWEHSRTPFEAPWLQHVLGKDWPDTIRLTFNAGERKTDISNPLTHDIMAWWRAACVAGVELGGPDMAWAKDALAWADKTFAASPKGPSIAWMIEPRTR